jgi:hypothetical protein
MKVILIGLVVSTMASLFLLCYGQELTNYFCQCGIQADTEKEDPILTYRRFLRK